MHTGFVTTDWKPSTSTLVIGNRVGYRIMPFTETQTSIPWRVREFPTVDFL